MDTIDYSEDPSIVSKVQYYKGRQFVKQKKQSWKKKKRSRSSKKKKKRQKRLGKKLVINWINHKINLKRIVSKGTGFDVPSKLIVSGCFYYTPTLHVQGLVVIRSTIRILGRKHQGVSLIPIIPSSGVLAWPNYLSSKTGGGSGSTGLREENSRSSTKSNSTPATTIQTITQLVNPTTQRNYELAIPFKTKAYTTFGLNLELTPPEWECSYTVQFISLPLVNLESYKDKNQWKLLQQEFTNQEMNEEMSAVSNAFLNNISLKTRVTVFNYNAWWVKKKMTRKYFALQLDSLNSETLRKAMIEHVLHPQNLDDSEKTLLSQEYQEKSSVKNPNIFDQQVARILYGVPQSVYKNFSDPLVAKFSRYVNKVKPIQITMTPETGMASLPAGSLGSTLTTTPSLSNQQLVIEKKVLKNSYKQTTIKYNRYLGFWGSILGSLLTLSNNPQKSSLKNLARTVPTDPTQLTSKIQVTDIDRQWIFTILTQDQFKYLDLPDRLISIVFSSLTFYMTFSNYLPRTAIPSYKPYTIQVWLDYKSDITKQNFSSLLYWGNPGLGLDMTTVSLKEKFYTKGIVAFPATRFKFKLRITVPYWMNCDFSGLGRCQVFYPRIFTKEKVDQLMSKTDLNSFSENPATTNIQQQGISLRTSPEDFFSNRPL